MYITQFHELVGLSQSNTIVNSTFSVHRPGLHVAVLNYLRNMRLHLNYYSHILSALGI
jgi:hypothetical protein